MDFLSVREGKHGEKERSGSESKMPRRWQRQSFELRTGTVIPVCWCLSEV